MDALSVFLFIVFILPLWLFFIGMFLEKPLMWLAKFYFTHDRLMKREAKMKAHRDELQRKWDEARTKTK